MSDGYKYKNYLISDLLKAFKKVEDKIHWKNAINAQCNKSEVEILRVAIPFYTGTIPFFYYTKNIDTVTVKADGYFLGPCR